MYMLFLLLFKEQDCPTLVPTHYQHQGGQEITKDRDKYAVVQRQRGITAKRNMSCQR